MKMNGKNIVSSFDPASAQTLSKSLHAKSFQIHSVDRLDSVIDEIVSSSPSFSHNQVQILVVVL